MSKGPGRVQRAIISAFDSAPDQRFTVSEMAALVYPGAPLEKRHFDAVHRALMRLTPALNLFKCRVGLSDAFCWQHVWGRR